MSAIVSISIKNDLRTAFFAAHRTGLAALFLLFIPYFIHADSKPEFFLGAGGKLYLPSLSLQTDFTPLFGGGGYFEGGFEIKDFQADCAASFAQFSGRERLAGMGEAKIALGASYLIRKNRVARLPAWLNLRPHMSVFADFYSAEFHKTSVGLGENPLFFDNGITAGFAPGFFVDFNLFRIKGQKIVPTAGLETTFRFDKNGGLFAAPVFSAGIRMFPKCPPKPQPIDSISEPAEFRLPPPKPIEKLPETQNEPEEIPPPIEDEIPPENDEPEEEASPPEEAAIQDEAEPAAAPKEEAVLPAPPQELLNIPFILFSPNASSLAAFSPPARRAAADALDEVARILNAHPDFELNILGYAHNVSGTDAENKRELLPLSQKRAESVRIELERRGIASERMHISGMGEGESPLPNSWKNRRVEFELIKANE